MRSFASGSVIRLASVLLLAVGVTPAPASGMTPGSVAPVCESVFHTVTVEHVGQQKVGGNLCLPQGVAPTTVHVLLSGGTYNSVYWDYPHRPEQYSYVHHATAHGHATLALDRLGVGVSDRPPGLVLTPQIQAEAIHQVIGALRTGTLGGPAFERVVLAGHSYGSILALLEAGTYRDVDAVIITGLLHWWNPTFLPRFGASSHPAMFDPKYSGRMQDPAYITTQPGARRDLFYGPDADPEIVALDEETKDVIGVTEAAVAVTLVYRDRSGEINAPVLVAVGSVDGAFCGAGATDCSTAESVLARERPYYRAAPRLAALVVPGSGHDVNLSPQGPAFFRSALQWLQDVGVASR